MSSIGDLVNNNPFYNGGVFLDGTYYQRNIPQSSWNDPAPSPEHLKRALIEQACLTAFSQALLVGCVLIPSIYVIGVVAVLPAMGSAVLCALMTYELDIHGGRGHDGVSTGLILGTKFQSLLLAALPQKEHYKALFKQAGYDAAIKTAFLGLVTFAPARVAVTLSHLGLFFVTYHFTRELEKLVLLLIEHYAQRAAARRIPVA
jgi:hypothetical protein